MSSDSSKHGMMIVFMGGSSMLFCFIAISCALMLVVLTGGGLGSGSFCDFPFPGWEHRAKGSDGKCASGFEATGCAGDLQCKRRAKPGLWVSTKYGGTGGKAFDESCKKDHYISSLQGWSNDKTINAIHASCYDPTAKEQKYNLFKSSNGIMGKPDKPASAGNWAATIFSMGMAGDTSRKMYKTSGFNDNYPGITAWDVYHDKEIRGIKVYAPNNTSHSWGDTSSGVPKSSGRCPNGKVLVGISGASGNRLDSLQFKCDAPYV
jgi:hypothetical protein